MTRDDRRIGNGRSILHEERTDCYEMEQLRIDAVDGRIIADIPEEDETSVTLSQQEGNGVVEVRVTKEEIERVRAISTSMMPGNFAELLAVPTE